MGALLRNFIYIFVLFAVLTLTRCLNVLEVNFFVYFISRSIPVLSVTLEEVEEGA